VTPWICKTESAKDTAINVLQAVNTMTTKKINKYMNKNIAVFLSVI